MLHWLFFRHTVSRLLLIGLFCLAVLIGIALTAAGWRIGGLGWTVVAGSLILACLRRPRVAVVAVVAAGCLVGLLRGSAVQARDDDLSGYMGQRVTMTIRVTQDPEFGQRGEQRFRAEILAIDNLPHNGVVAVTTSDQQTLRREDTLRIVGKVSDGFGPANLRIGYAAIQERLPALQPILQARDGFAASIQRTVDEPMAALGLGFLLGQRSALPSDLDDDMKLLGLTHIVVASGYNLTILVRVARRLLEGVSKFQAFSVSLGLMSVFMVVTGFSPSMVRAGAVTLLSLLVWYYGRQIHPLLLILLVAAGTALWNPAFVWSDIGWYLSFLSFIGVLVLAPMLSSLIRREGRLPLPAQVMVETIAAQILTLPLILWLFGGLPVLSVIANVLIVPLIPLAMLLVFIAGLVGLVAPSGLLPLVAQPAETLIAYMLAVVDVLAGVPWAQIDLAVPVPVMIALYAAVAAGLFLLARWLRFDFLRVNVTD